MRHNFLTTGVWLAVGAGLALGQSGAPEKDLIATGPLFIEPRPGAAAPAGGASASSASFPPKGTRPGEPAPSAANAAPQAVGVASLRVRGTCRVQDAG